jgi:dolichol kinase
MQLRSRFDDHLSRKFFHLISGTAVAYAFIYAVDRHTASLLVLSVTLVLVCIDMARIKVAVLNTWVLRFYGPLMRKEEETQPSAQLYYLLGLCWAILILPKVVAVQAILTLAWMDPIAGAYGVRFGKTRWNNVFRFFLPEERRISLSLGAKTVEGSMAGFVAALLAGILSWTGHWASVEMPTGGLYWPSPTEVLAMSLVGGLAAVVAEAWPSQWDDNAKIPFWTGVFVWAAALLMGLPLQR